MESDKNYQDLIREYQILLENEKRRLNFVQTEKCDVAEKDEQILQLTTTTTESSNILQHERHKIDENDKSTLKSSQNDLYKKEIVHDHLQEMKHDESHGQNDIHKRTKMMEQWVTDSFYTSFPSFKNQDLNANRLADDRREDYKRYLAEVSNKKLLDAVSTSARTNEQNSVSDDLMFISKPSEKMTFSARDKLLNDLKHSDLAFNFHNPNAIDDRNQKVAMDRARKKVELQQELIRQIEEKKFQIEKLRAKEKEEEEILQRRLENQIKALQMTDELMKINSEKVLISNPLNQRIRDSVPRTDLHSYNDNFKSEDKSPENRVRNDVIANEDRRIYKFFSNSAPHSDHHGNYYNSVSLVDPHSFPHNSTAMHNPSQHCTRCRRVVPILCSSCCHNDFCCYRCNLQSQNMDACNNCRRAWVQSWNHHCDVERYGVNLYSRDNRPQILEITYQDHSSQTNDSLSPPKSDRRSTSPAKSDKIKAIRSESPDANRNSLGRVTHNATHRSPVQYSNKIVGTGTTLTNVPETVSLSKEDELLELKRKNDILIAKHARNYGSLRHRKTVSKDTDPSQFTDFDAFPLPLMREHLSTTSSSKGDGVQPKRQNSQAVRKLEYKWEIPVVQKQVVTNKPDKVLTQVGAIGKQLQLERMNFGND